MNLQIEKTITVWPAFSTAEDAFMIEVDNLLGRFVEGLGDPKDMILVSQSTGEIISIDEIRRVRGILDALYHTCVWKVEE